MKSSPVRVLLIGAAGRMGKTVLDLAQSDAEIEIAAKCDLGDSIEPAMKNCNVAIDFSQADSIDEICRAALHHGPRWPRQSLKIRWLARIPAHDAPAGLRSAGVSSGVRRPFSTDKTARPERPSFTQVPSPLQAAAQVCTSNVP